MKWINCNDVLPAEGKVVNTKIEDENGIRNECLLIRQGNLWYHSDMSMYVYYKPTHWKN